VNASQNFFTSFITHKNFHSNFFFFRQQVGSQESLDICEYIAELKKNTEFERVSELVKKLLKSSFQN
jgi:hypothetical protein